jgi:hypothetical protein
MEVSVWHRPYLAHLPTTLVVEVGVFIIMLLLGQEELVAAVTEQFLTLAVVTSLAALLEQQILVEEVVAVGQGLQPTVAAPALLS